MSRDSDVYEYLSSPLSVRKLARRPRSVTCLLPVLPTATQRRSARPFISSAPQLIAMRYQAFEALVCRVLRATR